ncbi:MAG: acyl-CoA thioesterase [Bacteroidetes bacterium]|nr:acyl-CoA thioesterase [Bacteroidota bacterium]
MFKTETTIRVRYAETDRMNYVYYGNYASYFEVARVEALRGIGISYKKMEEEGFLLPVYEYNVKYFKPAFYDDVLLIKTCIPVMPLVRIVVNYEIYNDSSEKICEAHTTLVFMSSETNKPCKAPEEFLSKLRNYF